MKNSTKFALFALLSVLIVVMVHSTFVMAKSLRDEDSPQTREENTWATVQENSIVNISAPFHVKPVVLGVLMKDVIQCESGWTHTINGNIIRGKAGEYGICQFMPSTWKMFNLIRGTNLDIMDRDEQIDMMVWAFNNGYQNHWTCYRQLK